MRVKLFQVAAFVNTQQTTEAALLETQCRACSADSDCMGQFLSTCGLTKSAVCSRVSGHDVFGSILAVAVDSNTKIAAEDVHQYEHLLTRDNVKQASSM